MSTTDVIVVGGGPVGVTAALLLARRGFAVTVLERATTVYDLPRAIVMDDEIQRVYQGAGITDDLRAITTPLRGAEFVRPDGERIIGLELSPGELSPLGHPVTVAYYQPELEALLRRAAIVAGVDLRLGVEVRSVEQDDSSVRCETDRGVHQGRWLVAADGASSPVRKQVGIRFVDQGFDQDWLVLDVRLRRDVATLSPFVQQICDPVRPTTFVPGHGDYRRWEFQLQPGESRDAMTDPARVWGLLEPWITGDDAELVRAVVYRFHATVADSMRAGRVVLAGDAAHQMPPFLGQGLCSGVRDAANLAWKLRMVDDGTAGEALLDTYGAERLPHAAGVVAHAVDTGRLIDELSGRAPAATGLDAAYGGGRPFPFLEHGIRVGDHPAVGRQVPQPTIDGRPLDDLLGPDFAIVTDHGFPATVAASAMGSLASVVTVGCETMPFTLPRGGAAIVRPDRYVAAVASDPAELAAAGASILDQLAIAQRPDDQRPDDHRSDGRNDA
jgi:3-(3-hydroxy-phenyl)propionate hydroxylase